MQGELGIEGLVFTAYEEVRSYHTMKTKNVVNMSRVKQLGPVRSLSGGDRALHSTPSRALLLRTAAALHPPRALPPRLTGPRCRRHTSRTAGQGDAWVQAVPQVLSAGQQRQPPPGSDGGGYGGCALQLHLLKALQQVRRRQLPQPEGGAAVVRGRGGV